VIRVAAVGDVHMAADARGSLHDAFATLPEHADLLLLAGDLTRTGTEDELQVLLDELDAAAVPQFAVLGNHDFESDRVDALVKLLEGNGVRVLEGDADAVRIDGETLGIAGTKGFGGGFAGACGSDFGEPEMKAFVQHTRDLSDALGRALSSLDTDARIALTHFAPVKDTLGAERLEIYPFLGSYLLGEAIDRAGADLAVHGHAHNGAEKGVTPGGIPVRNVALPVLKSAYAVYCLGA
jgi:Icc-related predicted phosphoesterase